MSVRDTWAAMFEPERYPPPPLSGLGLSWRYGLSILWFFFMMGSWVFLLQGADSSTATIFGEPFVVTADMGAIPPVWVVAADGILGLVGLGIIHLRRRRPLAVTLVVHAFGIVSASVAVVGVWAYLSLASRRNIRDNLIALVATLAFSMVTYALPWAAPFRWGSLLASVIVASGMLLLGMYVGVRRDRAAVFLRRVEQAEQDRAFAVLAERNRIAREMHDVLAHRISLVSMHAGVLAYRDDLPPEKTREIAHVIQENAHASLTELRSVLSTLREVPSDAPGGADGSGGPVEAPQPTLAALPDLIEAVRASGQRLTVRHTLDADALPLVQQRHLYRIVQECLTNARKHAPRAAVDLELSGSPSDGVTVRVANDVTEVAGSIPGAKLGLVGITERASMLGGRLDAGVRGGRFVVEAWLPWDTDFRRKQ